MSTDLHGNDADGSDTADELGRMLDRLYADRLSPKRIDAAADTGYDRELWSMLDDLGVTLVGVTEGTLADAVALAMATGRAAAPLPVAEVQYAADLARCAGFAVCSAATASPAGDELRVAREGAGWRLTGRLRRVPNARWMPAGYALLRGARPQVARFEVAAARVTPGQNLAGEARDDLEFDVQIGLDDVRALSCDVVTATQRRAALLRSALVTGAAEAALDRCIRYAREREQFGRPLSTFDAIQTHLADMAAEISASRVGVEAATRTTLARGLVDPAAGMAVAAARVQASRAATRTARSAHQVHGAIGMTDEHPLRLWTTRLWAWSGEDGPARAWAAHLGREAVRVGSAGLWEAIVAAG